MIAGYGLIVVGGYLMSKGFERVIRHQIESERVVDWLSGKPVESPSPVEPGSTGRTPVDYHHPTEGEGGN